MAGNTERQDMIKLLEDLKAAGKATQEQLNFLARLKREAKATRREIEDTGESFSDFQDGMNEIGEGFGLRLGNMFKQIQVEVEQTSRDISSMFSDLEANAPEIASSIAEEFNSSFRNALPDPKDISAKINLNSLISEFKASFPEMGNEMQKAFKTGDIATFYKKFGDEGMKNLRQFLGDKKGFDGLKDYFKPGGTGEKGTANFRKQLESFEPAAQKTTKVIFNWNSMFKSIGDNILNYIGFGKIIKNLMDFDVKLSNIKREFQIPTAGFSKASSSMSDLVKYGAQFGLDNEKSFKLVKDIGEYAKSTNIQNLAATAKQVAAVSDATGISLETVGQLTGQMMFFGATAEKSRKVFVDIQKSASRFGVNVTSVSKQFEKVFPRFARMGFKAGEESLARMAAKAEKMGTDINKLLDASDKFIDMDAALEASADLSLLGGAAAQVSFMDLMKAAQDGPEAMDKLMTQMTSDIGKLNKDGKLQLSMIDRQKIKKIAEASGEDVESVTNRITSRLQDQAKKAALPPGLFNGLKDEEKDFLLSKMVNKGGKWKFEGLNGITDLKNVSQGSIQAMMNKSKSDAENMEKAAKNRQALEEKLNNLANEVLAAFTAFQPYLEILKQALDKVRSMFVSFGKVIDSVFGAKYGSWIKTMLLLGGILMLTFGPTAMAKFAGILFRGITSPFKMLGGLGSKLSSAFKGAGGAGKKMSEAIPDKFGPQTQDFGPKMKKMKTPPTMLQQFSKINPAQILSLAAAFIALGIAMLLIGKGIQFAATGLATLVKSFNDTKNAGAALGAIAIVMGGFVAMVYILATASTIAALPLLGLGAAMLMLGGAVYLAAKGFAVLVPAIISMGKNIGATVKGAAGLIALAAALLIISPALLVFGAAGLVAAPAMIAFGYFLRGLGAAKGVNPGLIKQIGNSMGSIAWGLVKLGLAAGPAALAMITGAALMVVAVALKNISTVDVKKIGQFGQSLGAVSASMIKGLIKLGLVSPFAVLAMVSAGSIWAISQALSRIKLIDLKKMQNFGDSMGKVGMRMIWGLIKLGAVSPFVVLGVVSAGGINLISKLLADVKIVDLKKIQAFGQSLGAVSLSMIWGLTKLGLVSPFVVLGVVSAGGINLISRMLSNIPLINSKTLKSNASALSSASWTFVKAFLKLLPLAVLTPTALLAAGGILGVTKMLKAVPTLNTKSLKEAAGVVSSIAWPFVKAFFKLQAVAVLAPLALLAGIGILGVTKALSAVPKLNPSFLITTASVLSQVAGPFAKALLKLAFGSIGAFAVIGANAIKKITEIFSTLKPLNPVLLISVAATLGAVSGKFGKSLLKLGLLGIFAGPAIFASVAISKITQILSKLTPLNSKKLISTATALSISSTSFLKGLIKFGVLGIFAVPAILAAKSVSIVVNLLSKLPKLNPAKLAATGLALSLSANSFLKGLVKFGLLGVVAVPAIIAAASVLKVTRLLSQVPLLNPVKLITTANTLSKMAGPLAKGLLKVALTLPLTIPALLASLGILGTTKVLSRIPFLNPAKLITTANTLNRISGPFLKGLLKIALTAPIGITALLAAVQILGVTKALSLVPFLNPVKLITTANTLNAISWPLFKGLLKIAGTAVTANLALVAAIGILGTTKMLAAVPLLSPAKLILTATTLAFIASPLSKGLIKIGLLAPFAALAFVSAVSILGITKVLANLPVIPIQKIISLAGVLRGIGNLSGGLLALGLMSVFAIPALVGAIALRSVVKVLASMPAISPIKIIFLGGALRGIGNLSKGLVALGLMSVFAVPALVGAIGLRTVVKVLAGMPTISPIKIIFLAGALRGIGNLSKGLIALGLVSVFVAPAIIGAIGLRAVTKLLAGVPLLMPTKFAFIALSLSTSGAIAKGMVKLSLISPFVIPATIAAIGLRTVAKLLAGVPLLMPTKFTFIALSLATAGGIAKGMIKLSLISPFIVPATIAAIGLRTVAKLLAGVPLLMPAKFAFIALSLSASLQIAKGLIKLSVISPFILPATVAAIGLRAVTRILASVPMLTPTKFAFIALSLATSGSIAKGLIKLSLISPFILPATIAAIGLRTITRLLAGVPLLMPTKFAFIALSLATSGAIAKGMVKLSLISPFVIPATIAAIGLRTVTRLLAGVPLLMPTKFAFIALSLATSGAIAKGMVKLSLISPFVVPALVAAYGLRTVTRILAGVPMLLPNKFSFIAISLNASGSIAKGLIKLSTISVVAAPALIAAYALRAVTRILAGVPFLLPNKFLFVAASLNTSGTIAKGLAKLSIISAYAVPAMVAAIALRTVTRILSGASFLNPVKFAMIGITLNTTSLTIAKGLAKLSLITPLAIPALVAAKSLSLVTRILATSAFLNPVKFSLIALTLNSTSGTIAKGLAKLSLITPIALPAIIAAKSLSMVTRILATSAFLNPVKFSFIALTLNNTSGPIAKGLAKLSIIAPLAFPAIVAAKAVNMVTKILASSPILVPAVFSLIAKTLDSYSMPIAKGLIKLSIVGPFAIPAIVAAKAVRTISYILFAVLPLSMAKMSSIANVLSRTSGPIAKGLLKLAIIGPLSPLAIYAANNLLKISKTLAQVPFLSSKNLMSVANTMSSTTWSLLKALGKFASLSLVILPAIGISAGLVKLSQNLSKVVMINPVTLHMLSATLNSVSGKLFTGLGKFSASGLFMIPAGIVAAGLVGITKLLNLTIPINRAKITNIGTTLFTVSPILTKGLITFSKMGIYLIPAVAAALGVVAVTRILSKSFYINSKRLINIGDTLFYASPNLSRGFIVFSRAGFYAIQAIVAAKSLISITRSLQLVKPLNYKTLSNIGYVLSTTSSNIVKGLRLLSAAVLFGVPALIASRFLVPISNLLSKVVFVPYKNMYQLGLVTNNTSGQIFRGLLKLSAIVPLLPTSIIAAAGLVRLTKIINQIQTIFFKNLLQLGNVINGTAFSILKGLAKFSAIVPFIVPSIFAAFGLVRLTKIINQIQTIFYKNLLQLGNVLNTTGFLLIKGMAKFSAIVPFIIPSIFAAMGLVRFTKVVNQIQTIFYKNLLQLGNVLGTRSIPIVKGLAKFSSIGLFIIPSILAAYGLVKFSKVVNGIIPVSYAKLFSVGFVLTNTTSGMIKGLLKFATLYFFVGPAIISAYAVRKLSKILMGVMILPAAPLINLAVLLNTTGGSLIKGMLKWALMSPFIIPSIIVAMGINRIFRSLSSVANLNLEGLKKNIPTLGLISTPLFKFSKLGFITPLLVSASIGLAALSRSMKIITGGFLSLSIVPWGIINKAIPVINALMSSLIKFGFQGLMAAPGIIAMAMSMRVLGKSMFGVASGFAVSTKSLADYNKERDRLKAVAVAPKPSTSPESMNMIQRAKAAAMMGAEINSRGREGNAGVAKKETSGPQIVQIKPIQIDLKLNGRVLQQLIVEANYNRT